MYAFSSGENIICHSSQNINDTYAIDTKQKIKTVVTGDCNSVILFKGKMTLNLSFTMGTF